MMRVKIGDRWHEATAEQPIMIEFSSGDRRNIARMLPEATKYAVFADGDQRSRDEKLEWME